MPNRQANNAMVFEPPPAIVDTISATQVIQRPAEALARFRRQAALVWLPPQTQSFADTFIESLAAQSRAVWGTVAGPFGFGKTSTLVAMAGRFEKAGLIALPPLSATSLEEYAEATRVLLRLALPDEVFHIEQAWSKVYGRKASTRIAKTELRAIDRAHRLVEFLGKLLRLGGRLDRGIVLFLDELQQMLGVLDTASIVEFREFVWGLRSEGARCGVVLCLDPVLEARIDRWAADILHRIREMGHTLRLEEVYNREFPGWLWPRWAGAALKTSKPPELDPELLTSLGQFVERWDLTNGPRTVVDVFTRAVSAGVLHYGIGDLVEDTRRGSFRYFAGGVGLEILLNNILADAWITGDPDRETLIRTLAAFPSGCPNDILARHLPESRARDRAISDTFGPLLVRSNDGLALEALQRVRRPVLQLDDVLLRAWETLPAYDALLSHAAEMLGSIVLPHLLNEGRTVGSWAVHDSSESENLTGWRRYRGSFDDDFPDRLLAIASGNELPKDWPRDVDLGLFFVITDEKTTDLPHPQTILEIDSEVARVKVAFPALRPIMGILPAEIERYRKFIDPEPFRPLSLLAALTELSHRRDDGTTEFRLRADAFTRSVIEILLRSSIQGSVELRPGAAISQSGAELVRALFSQAMRRRYPGYVRLARDKRWREALKIYRQALHGETVTSLHRDGLRRVEGEKADLYEGLFRQPSTAAGDSFVRSLGPLIICHETGRKFAFTFTSHPAERALLEAVQRNTGQRGLPTLAARDELMRRGWTHEEADETIAIALSRGTIAEIQSGLLGVGHESKWDEVSQATRDRLEHEAAELGLTGKIAPEHLANAVKMRRDELLDEAANLSTRLFEAIGRLRAADVPEQWGDLELSIHLSGIAKELSRARASLLTRARRLSASIPASDLNGWASRRSRIIREMDQLGGRMAEFNGRVAGLLEWRTASGRLSGISAAVRRLSGFGDRTLAEMLDEVIAQFRERFATAKWQPLAEAKKFDQLLDPLEEKTQRLLYDRLVGYDDLRRELVESVGWASLERPPNMREVANLEELTFGHLIRWALAATEIALAKTVPPDSQRRWRDPKGTKVSFSDIKAQAVRALAEASRAKSDKAVTAAAALVRRLADGFGSSFDVPRILR